MDLGDTVADLDDRSDLVDGHAGIEILDLGTDDLVDLVGFDCFHFLCLASLKFLRPGKLASDKFLFKILQLRLHGPVVAGGAAARDDPADDARSTPKRSSTCLPVRRSR